MDTDTRRKTPEPPIRPAGALEDRLYEAQARIVDGQKALEDRNELLERMRGGGYTLRYLTGILNQAAVDGGGEPVTEDAVQKAVRLRRSKAGR